MDSLPPFPGFRPEALAFLRDLRAHNEREWFKPRKATYDDELLWPARCLVANVAGEAARAGLPLMADPMKGIFRIYRDTRFSKNKDPYKTHVGLVWTRSGHKGDEGALYVHVEPGGCFLGAGFWAPEAPLLRAWRERIAGDAAGWLATVAEVEAAGLTVGGREALKRMPRGYESFADSDVAEALRWKGAVATQAVPDADVQRPDFARQVVAFGQAALPLLQWGWSVEDM
ncbi:MAG TPA: DUF2461 domain-containing protein [Rubricoccaceae bacterium]|jgi:uncharacterized protein (TIGR02453 family)